MIRTPRSAALAVLAAAALVGIPGTAFADASGLGAGSSLGAGPGPGAGFNNGIVINHVTEYAGGEIINSDDDGIVSVSPGVTAPFAQFRLLNKTFLQLERTNQQGADYPPYLFPGSTAVIATSAPSTADYVSIDRRGRVHIDATRENSPTCNGEGSLRCQVEYSAAGLDLVITGG